MRIRKNRSLIRPKEFKLKPQVQKKKSDVAVSTITRKNSLNQLDQQNNSTGCRSRDVSPKDKVISFNPNSSTLFKCKNKEIGKLAFDDPTEEMNMRWLKLVQRQAPTVDLVDISDEVNPFYSQKR